MANSTHEDHILLVFAFTAAKLAIKIEISYLSINFLP